MTTKSKKVVVYCRDCGDGSHAVLIFENEEKALQYLNEQRKEEAEWAKKRADYDENDPAYKLFDSFDELTEWQSEDPYERGSCELVTLNFDIFRGKLTIPKYWFLSFGG